MKNIERIQELSAEDFAEYIQSVFIAGRLYENKKTKSDPENEMIDYVEWLNEESKKEVEAER